MNSFTAQQFAEGLNSPEGLALPHIPLTIIGMAKKSSSPLTISFALGSTCSVWVPIPVALIEKVDHLGKITCKDHEHDHARLHFVNPTTDEGKALTELLKQMIGLDESWLPQPMPSQPSPSLSLAPNFAGHQETMSFGWHPPHIPTPHWPPIHIPDPRDALRKQAEQLARATAAKIDHEKGSSTYCPREEIRAGILAVGMTLYLTPDPTGGSKFMAGVMGVIALTLPDEYCRQSGR